MTQPAIHDLLPQLAANRRYWTGWSGAEPDADLVIYRTNLTHPLLNGVLRVRDQPLDEAIQEAQEQLKGATWSWWAGVDSDDGTADGLLARGAEQVGDVPVMALDLTTLVPGFVAPDGLTIRPVTGRDEITKYVRAYAEPLRFDLSQVDPAVERELNFAYPEVIRLAGIIGGETVGTCTLSLGTEVAALYCIATVDGHRRAGIATALTLEALRLARESGRTIATLQSSSDGLPLYERIGFETVTRYGLFQLPE